MMQPKPSATRWSSPTCPGAADRDRRPGTRLGRGKGHYDRALTRLKKIGARLVGVGWSLQRLADVIPADDWDIPLNGFASPDGLEWFR